MATIQHTDNAYPPGTLAPQKAIELAGAGGITKYACLGIFNGDFYFLSTQQLEINAVTVTGNTSPVIESVAYDPFDASAYGEFRKGFAQRSQTSMNLLRDLTIAISDDSSDWNTTINTSDITTSATGHTDGYFDFIWLDLPSKDQTSMDAAFNAWMPKVRSGGVIGGVQYTDSITYNQHAVSCGIKASVDAQVAAQSTDLHVYINAGNQWLFTKA